MDTEEEDVYEELPWQQIALSRNAQQQQMTFDIALRTEPLDAPDEFTQSMLTLRTMMIANHFSEDLYHMIDDEMTGPYNTWLKGLQGQPLEFSILQTMANIGFYKPENRRLLIPNSNVVEANSRLAELEESKKRMNYVIHRLQEYRLRTTGSNQLLTTNSTTSSDSTGTGTEETKEDDVEDYRRPGQEHFMVNAILQKIIILADHLYKVMDSATIMSMNFSMLLENSHPDKWFRVNDLVGCEFQKFLYISKPISMEDSKKFDRHTKLVIFLLDKFRERKFRKKTTSDYLYQQIFFTQSDGTKVCTYSYSPIKESIEQLVYEMVRKEFRGDLWSTILHAGILKDVVVYIKKCVDDEVPDVKELPRMWSFQDGIYCAETDVFSYYRDVPSVFPLLAQGFSTYKFMQGHNFAHVYYRTVSTNDQASVLHTPRQPRHRAHTEVGPILSGMSSIQSPRPSPFHIHHHHNSQNDEYESMTGDNDDNHENHDDDIMDDNDDRDDDHVVPPKRTLEEIEMPNLTKIFQDQGWSDQTIFLKLATLGRTFWPAGTLDNCQYWPCDWGVGGSGKSTVQDVFKYLFHWQDVGIFGADQEDTFSRDSLPDKRIIIAPEVRGDNFGCSLAFFLSIVAGDSVRIPVKYGQPRDVENFPVQGLMATNELPKSYLNDPKGSVARRILVFPWPRVIHPRDPTLKGRIVREELPAVLRACAMAYHRLPKDVDIMSDYPLAPEMSAARARLQRASNSMVDFLLSEDYVQRGPNLCVDVDVFRKTYNFYVKEVRNERQLPPWNDDLYDYPFRLLRIKLKPGDENNPAQVVGCSMRVEIQ